MHDPIFSLPDPTRSFNLRQARVDACPVVWMYEPPHFLTGERWHLVPVNLGGTYVTLEVTGGEIDAESTQRSTVKRLLQMFLALLEHRFAATPLGEQRCKDQDQQRANQYESLCGEN